MTLRSPTLVPAHCCPSFLPLYTVLFSPLCCPFFSLFSFLLFYLFICLLLFYYFISFIIFLPLCLYLFSSPRLSSRSVLPLFLPIFFAPSISFFTVLSSSLLLLVSYVFPSLSLSFFPLPLTPPFPDPPFPPPSSLLPSLFSSFPLLLPLYPPFSFFPSSLPPSPSLPCNPLTVDLVGCETWLASSVDFNIS